MGKFYKTYFKLSGNPQLLATNRRVTLDASAARTRLTSGGVPWPGMLLRAETTVSTLFSSRTSFKESVLE